MTEFRNWKEIVKTPTILNKVVETILTEAAITRIQNL